MWCRRHGRHVPSSFKASQKQHTLWVTKQKVTKFFLHFRDVWRHEVWVLLVQELFVAQAKERTVQRVSPAWPSAGRICGALSEPRWTFTVSVWTSVLWEFLNHCANCVVTWKFIIKHAWTHSGTPSQSLQWVARPLIDASCTVWWTRASWPTYIDARVHKNGNSYALL